MRLYSFPDCIAIGHLDRELLSLPLFTNAHQCRQMKTTAKLEKTLYTRVTDADFQVLTSLADQRQQSISQVIRKALIDQQLLARNY